MDEARAQFTYPNQRHTSLPN